MTLRKKPTAGFWITVALVAVLVGYPLSFGPACWISGRLQPSGRFVSVAYRPILRIWIVGPAWVETALGFYVTVGADSKGVKFYRGEPPEIEFTSMR
jgi:hypothetical protein